MKVDVDKLKQAIINEGEQYLERSRVLYIIDEVRKKQATEDEEVAAENNALKWL